MWIDSHAHFFEFDNQELTNCLANAASHDVGAVISTAINLPSAHSVVRQCSEHPTLFGAIGISPFDVINLPDDWLATLQRLLRYSRIIAIGEIGIDSTNPRYPALDVQQPCFEQQLVLAKSEGIPAIIHSRGSEERAVAICKDVGIEKVLFHCFTGNDRALHALLNAGYSLSLSGIVTFKKSDLRKLVAAIPLERLFIETDSPYLAPVPHRGKPNQPAWVSLVGTEVALLCAISVPKLQQILANNFSRFFAVPLPPDTIDTSHLHNATNAKPLSPPLQDELHL